jgi:primosomal protein N' (replication factor Y)
MTEDSTDLFDDLFARRVVPVLVPMPAETLLLCRAGGNGCRAGLDRAGAARAAPGDGRGLGWDRRGSVDPKKLKADHPVFDCPPLAKEMRDFIDWVASYTLSPPGLVARMALRAPAAFDPEPMVEGLRFVGGCGRSG